MKKQHKKAMVRKKLVKWMAYECLQLLAAALLQNWSQILDVFCVVPFTAILAGGQV